MRLTKPELTHSWQSLTQKEIRHLKSAREAYKAEGESEAEKIIVTRYLGRHLAKTNGRVNRVSGDEINTYFQGARKIISGLR